MLKRLPQNADLELFVQLFKWSNDAPWFSWNSNAYKRNTKLTSVSFWRGVKEATNDFGFGRSRGSDCKHREANRTNSVASSESCPSKQESVSIWRFLSRIRSRAWYKIISHQVKKFTSVFTLNLRRRNHDAEFLTIESKKYYGVGRKFNIKKQYSFPVNTFFSIMFPFTTQELLTWLGGICFPLRRSSKRVPKLYITLSGVTLPAWQGTWSKVIDLSCKPMSNYCTLWVANSSQILNHKYNCKYTWRLQISTTTWYVRKNMINQCFIERYWEGSVWVKRLNGAHPIIPKHYISKGVCLFNVQ